MQTAQMSSMWRLPQIAISRICFTIETRNHLSVAHDVALYRFHNLINKNVAFSVVHMYECRREERTGCLFTDIKYKSDFIFEIRCIWTELRLRVHY